MASPLFSFLLSSSNFLSYWDPSPLDFSLRVLFLFYPLPVILLWTYLLRVYFCSVFRLWLCFCRFAAHPCTHAGLISMVSKSSDLIWAHQLSLFVVFKAARLPDNLFNFANQRRATMFANFRGISLIDVAAKHFACNKLNCFVAVQDARTRSTQCGFVEGEIVLSWYLHCVEL